MGALKSGDSGPVFGRGTIFVSTDCLAGGWSVQTIQNTGLNQSLAGDGQVGQQQAHRGGRHFGITGCQAIDPWPLHSFQVRQSLQTRHLDVGRGGSRHGRLTASTHFGEGASCSNSAAGRQPRRGSRLPEPLQAVSACKGLRSQTLGHMRVTRSALTQLMTPVSTSAPTNYLPLGPSLDPFSFPRQ